MDSTRTPLKKREVRHNKTHAVKSLGIIMAMAFSRMDELVAWHKTQDNKTTHGMDSAKKHNDLPPLNITEKGRKPSTFTKKRSWRSDTLQKMGPTAVVHKTRAQRHSCQKGQKEKDRRLEDSRTALTAGTDTSWHGPTPIQKGAMARATGSPRARAPRRMRRWMTWTSTPSAHWENSLPPISRIGNNASDVRT